MRYLYTLYKMAILAGLCGYLPKAIAHFSVKYSIRHPRDWAYEGCLRYGERNSKSDFAYYFGAAMSTYTKNGNRWVVGGEYLEKHYPYKDLQIPVEQFTAEGGYYLKFLSDRRKTFFLSLGLPALAGYETSNRSEKLLPDGSTLLDKDCFVYGGALTLELEAYQTDRVALLLNARERALFGSDIGKFHTQVSLGLKFIIN